MRWLLFWRSLIEIIVSSIFSDCLITKASELGRDAQLAKKLYKETMKILKVDEIEKDEESE